jgi:hypothetical protein
LAEKRLRGCEFRADTFRVGAMQIRLGFVASLLLLTPAGLFASDSDLLTPGSAVTEANPFASTNISPSTSGFTPSGVFAPSRASTPSRAFMPAGASTSVADMFGQAATPNAPGASRNPSWGMNFNLGFGGAGGDLGELLVKPVEGDFNLFRNHEKWRFGLGLSFSSFKMKEPYQDEDEWGFQQTYLFATRMLRTEGSVRPYIQVRAGLARLHPRSQLFAFTPPPEAVGDSPTKPANGWSAGLVPGVEIQLNKSLALDLSGYFNYVSVSEYDLSPVGYPNAKSGNSWEARFGFRWHPDDGWPSGPRVAGGPDRERDAWGVSRNLGWAVGETLALNWVASGINEYIRNANFNQISPRSWWYNLDHGLTYDDNEFHTNQYLHPWNGANYYNSARGNGFGYWASSLFAIGGAFFWECCGETHPMSFNDLISTGIGGIAVGEEMYRVTNQILDNRDTGFSRVLREGASLVIDPTREFNRLLSGRASTSHDNPGDPLDFRGPTARFFVMMGARTIGEGESITENTKTYGFFGLNHSFGSVFDNDRRKPFDSLVADYQFSPGEEKGFRTVLRIRGDLFSKAFGYGGPDGPRYAWAIVQHFDYHNNQAYEFGQQAFGPSLFARYRLSDSMGLSLRWDGWASILAAVNSDYAFIADVADRERYREYDYGPGLGTGLEVYLSRGKNRLLSLTYRFQWIHVSNGSLFNKGDEFELPGGGTVTALGSDAKHYLQAVGARLFVPLYKRKIGVGADGLVLLRKSYYSSPILRDQDQRNPEARFYVAFDLGH